MELVRECRRVGSELAEVHLSAVERWEAHITLVRHSLTGLPACQAGCLGWTGRELICSWAPGNASFPGSADTADEILEDSRALLQAGIAAARKRCLELTRLIHAIPVDETEY